MNIETTKTKDFDRETEGLTREQAYIRLKRKYAMPHVGTPEYHKIIKKITDYLKL